MDSACSRHALAGLPPERAKWSARQRIGERRGNASLEEIVMAIGAPDRYLTIPGV